MGGRRIALLFVAAGMVSTLVGVGAGGPVGAQSGAAVLNGNEQAALDGVSYAGIWTDTRGLAILTAPQGSFNGFPTKGDTALIISTGDASVVNDPAKGALEDVINGDQAGTELGGALTSVDGNDMTRIEFQVSHAAGTSPCVTFDYLVLTEEYPNYVDQVYNDTFTAELGDESQLSSDQGRFVLQNGQVLAPFNFAAGQNGELVSINTFESFVPGPTGTTLNAGSPVLSASVQGSAGTYSNVVLTVQDIGDSSLDTAVIIDNVRQTTGACQTAGATVDSDGDGLPDAWETNGIDYDRDGVPELDLPAMGADPNRKDLFIELDWMLGDPRCVGVGTAAMIPTCGENLGQKGQAADQDKTPQAAALKRVVDAFATQGISLHIDAGPSSLKSDGKPWGSLARGNSIDYRDKIMPLLPNGSFDWTDVRDIKLANFDPVRRDVFHYGVYANWYGDAQSSGYGQLPGSDFIVTFPNDPTVQQEAGTLMHEFGHNLGFQHERAGEPDAERNGSPNPFQIANLTIMSYCFQFLGVDASGTLDFSQGTGTGTWPCGDDPDNPGVVGTAQGDLDHNEWDEIVWTGRGAIGGAAGGNVVEPESVDYDPLTADEARERGVFAFDGDGSVVALGPDLLAAGVDGQSILVQVANPSADASTYRIELDAPWGADPVEVTVEAESIQRVEVPVRAERATNSVTDIAVTLTNADRVLSSDNLEVRVTDLTNADAAAELQQLLDDGAEEFYELDVLELLRSNVEPVLRGDVTPNAAALEPRVAEFAAPGADDGIPLGAVGAILGGLVFLLLVGAIALRRS